MGAPFWRTTADELSRLLAAERLYRIDLRRDARRQVAGEGRDAHESQRDGHLERQPSPSNEYDQQGGNQEDEEDGRHGLVWCPGGNLNDDTHSRDNERADR